MIRDIKEVYSNWIEAKMDTIHWGKDLDLFCTSMDQLSYVEKCMNYFDSLSNEMKKELARCVFRYYKKSMEFFSQEEMEEFGSIKEEDILNTIYISNLAVDEECRKGSIEFHIEANSGWDLCCGIEITISDGKILYVGPYENEPPYLYIKNPERGVNDEWNCAIEH